MGIFDDDLVIVPLKSDMFKHASDKAQLVVCEQGTEEWHTARNGIPTGSAISKLITPTGKPRTGAAVEEFAYELAMNKVYGRDMDEYVSKAMEAGKLSEPIARKLWCELTGNSVEEVGFVYYDDSKRWGCSPDGLFESSGMLGCLEIKSVQRKAISGFMAQIKDGIEIPKDHYQQLQFNMWTCGSSIGSYVVFFDSRYPIIMERQVEVDHELVAGFEEALPQFSAKIEAAVKHIRESRGKLLR